MDLSEINLGWDEITGRYPRQRNRYELVMGRLYDRLVINWKVPGQQNPSCEPQRRISVTCRCESDYSCPCISRLLLQRFWYAHFILCTSPCICRNMHKTVKWLSAFHSKVCARPLFSLRHVNHFSRVSNVFQVITSIVVFTNISSDESDAVLSTLELHSELVVV
jgi:hypothetical protein